MRETRATREGKGGEREGEREAGHSDADVARAGCGSLRCRVNFRGCLRRTLLCLVVWLFREGEGEEEKGGWVRVGGRGGGVEGLPSLYQK